MYIYLYSFSFSSDYGSQQNDIIPPSPDVQPVIDKMALYVAKNGIEFEMVVKNKCDPRFEFLNKDHLHHPYYEFKKQLHIKVSLVESQF